MTRGPGGPTPVRGRRLEAEYREATPKEETSLAGGDVGALDSPSGRRGVAFALGTPGEQRPAALERPPDESTDTRTEPEGR